MLGFAVFTDWYGVNYEIFMCPSRAKDRILVSDQLTPQGGIGLGRWWCMLSQPHKLFSHCKSEDLEKIHGNKNEDFHSRTTARDNRSNTDSNSFTHIHHWSWAWIRKNQNTRNGQHFLRQGTLQAFDPIASRVEVLPLWSRAKLLRSNELALAEFGILEMLEIWKISRRC